MTIERFYELLAKLISADSDLNLQSSLTQIRDSLNNLTSQPNAAQHQTSLKNALEAFEVGTAELGRLIGLSDRRAIEEIGGKDFFDPSISASVADSISHNAMTPAVARDFVQNLTNQRAIFLETLKSTAKGIGDLGITQAEEANQPEVSVGFSIPRNLFDDQLDTFANELRFIDRLLRNIQEASTGQVTPPRLGTLASSIPTVVVWDGLLTLKLLGVVINEFLDAWKKIEKIREIRTSMANIGFDSGPAVKQIDEHIEAAVSDAVEKSKKSVMRDYPKKDGRQHELDTGLDKNLRRLFSLIESGLTVEIKVKADADDEDSTSDLHELKQIADRMDFPAPTQEPKLLKADLNIEDDTATVGASKSATAQTRTAKKKKAE